MDLKQCIAVLESIASDTLILNQLTPEDRQRLRWDPENIDWADYWVNIHTKGIEKWIRPVFVKPGKPAETVPF